MLITFSIIFFPSRKVHRIFLKQQPTMTQIKTSTSIFAIAEDEAAIPFEKGLKLFIDQTEDTDDGTWTRVSDYTRFCNRVDSGDTKAIQNFLIGNRRKSLDYGAFFLTKDSDDGFIVTFISPVKVLFGEISGEPVVKTIKELKGKISWDFFFKRNGRQDKIANGIEFLIEDIEFTA